MMRAHVCFGLFFGACCYSQVPDPGARGDDSQRLTESTSPPPAPEPAPQAPEAVPTPVVTASPRCRSAVSNGAPPQRPVPDERLIAVVERAAAELIEACAEEDARITEAALMAAARDCVGATSEGALRLSVCQEEACCVIGLGSRRVPEGTDDHGDWVIVRAPLQIDDYVDRVYWIADDGRIELMCRWPPYVAPECQAEDGLADDLDSTGCAGSPREWAELGEATRRFLCQSAI